MSRAITIEVKGERTLRPGQRVQGTVRVEVEKKTTCKALTLTLQQVAHGRGNTRTHSADVEVLFTGEWAPGVYTYPFNVLVPDGGPFTYHGHYLNIDWQLHAAADVPWALDPKDTVDLVVMPDPARDLTASPPMRMSDALEQLGHGAGAGALMSAAGSPQALVFLAMGGIFSLVGGFITLLGLILAVTGEPAMILMALFGGVFLAVGLVVIFLGVRNRVASSAIGEVEVDAPWPSLPGDEVVCSVRFTPNRRVPINRVTLKLLGREVVVSGSGTNRTTYTHVLHEEEIELCGQQDAQAGQPIALTGTLRLPEDAPLSVSMTDNSLIWGLDIRVDIARWPDWTRLEQLWVVPYRAASPGATAPPQEAPGSAW